MTGSFFRGPRAAWPAVLGLLLVLACTRPIDRPVEGARSRSGDGSPAFGVEVPPTVAAPTASVVVPPPILIAQASPSPSPAAAGRNPILSGLLPAPNALVQPGAVNIGARISGASDLTTVSLTVNGAAVQPRITTQDPRTWLVAHTTQLDVGKHQIRLNAIDQDGRAGGYTWQFDVQPRGQPSPVPRLAPTPRP